MADRITRKGLDKLVEHINKKLNRPAHGGGVGSDGKWRANVGHLFIDQYNPGDNPCQYKLAEMSNEAGAEYDWTNYRMTAREFDAYLRGIIAGLEARYYLASQSYPNNLES